MAELARGLATGLARPGRVIPPEPRNETRVGTLDLFLTSVWFGSITGLLELGENLAARAITGTISYETIRTNWHFAWMIPVSNLVLFGAVGLILGLLARRFQRESLFRLAIYLNCFLASLALLLAIPKLYEFALLVMAAGVARQVGRPIAARPDGLRRLVRRTLPALAVATLVLVTWQWTAVSQAESRALAALPPARPGAPNVLLIVLDTVRADALSPYGSKRDTTPNLARLARDGVRFDSARSTAPWTLPSHASLFTGHWPHDLSARTAEPLDSREPTLAEFLAGQGYNTAGFVANTHNCNAWYGLNRGFAHYEDFYENTTMTAVEVLRSSQLGRIVLFSKTGQRVIKSILSTPKYVYRKTAAMINRDALAWLSKQDDRPFFIFLNYYDAHDPYVPPKGSARTFARAGAGAATPRSVMEVARDDYDDCLVYLDDQLGHLFDALKRRGVIDNTLMIVAADHGESFGEHGLAGHGVSLYRPELHVPLLVVFPSRVPAGRTVSSPVSLRTVPATVADLLDLADRSPFPGRSLAGCWGPEDKVVADSEPEHPVLSQVDRADHLPPELSHVPAGRGLMRSITVGDWVYIRNGDGREELYDVQSDPDEHHDLSRTPSARAELERLRSMLQQLSESDPLPRDRDAVAVEGAGMSEQVTKDAIGQEKPIAREPDAAAVVVEQAA